MTGSARVVTGRRSQEERSAATRERLLDATIECLIELGYARTTTTEVARRAGVSRGAQVHHFPTKADLVQSAVVHLASRRREELRNEFARIDGNGDRVALALDMLWSAYAGPLFAAALELIVAARTDPALRPALAKLQDDLRVGVETFCREAFGARALTRRSFRDALELTVGMMGGLALSGLLDEGPRRDGELLQTWKRLVRPLLEETTGDARGRSARRPAYGEDGKEGRTA